MIICTRLSLLTQPHDNATIGVLTGEKVAGEGIEGKSDGRLGYKELSMY